MFAAILDFFRDDDLLTKGVCEEKDAEERKSHQFVDISIKDQLVYIKSVTVRHVSWATTERCILVPQNVEYRQAGIILWEESDVYDANKAVLEHHILNNIKQNPGLSPKDALKEFLEEDETRVRQQEEKDNREYGFEDRLLDENRLISMGTNSLAARNPYFE